MGALGVSAFVFGAIVLALGDNPLDVYESIYIGGFGSWFSWQNTLQRVATLLLTALCAALPTQLGLAVIGGEGAFVLGGIAVGALVVGAAGFLRAWRGVNETSSSLLINYPAIAIFYQLVEGPLRDPSDLNRASTYPVPDRATVGMIGDSSVHWGLPVGFVACGLAWFVIFRTTAGFAMRVAGRNAQAARMVGISVGRLIVAACAIGGAAAGLAGNPGGRGGQRARHNPLLIAGPERAR